MACIAILDSDEPFDWSPIKPETGERSESVFSLRIVTDEVDRKLRLAHTRPAFDKTLRAMVDQLDLSAYTLAVIDAAIVDWRNVKAASTGADLPCTVAMKARLPERLKSEILRLCANKEGGEVMAAAAEEKKRSSAT